MCFHHTGVVGTLRKLLLLSANFLLMSVVISASVNQPKKADKVIVLKQGHELQLLTLGKVFKTYKVALGGEPLGPKMQQGDHKTPEGTYVLDRRNARSQFHRALHISY